MQAHKVKQEMGDESDDPPQVTPCVKTSLPKRWWLLPAIPLCIDCVVYRRRRPSSCGTGCVLTVPVVPIADRSEAAHIVGQALESDNGAERVVLKVGEKKSRQRKELPPPLFPQQLTEAQLSAINQAIVSLIRQKFIQEKGLDFDSPLQGGRGGNRSKDKGKGKARRLELEPAAFSHAVGAEVLGAEFRTQLSRIMNLAPEDEPCSVDSRQTFDLTHSMYRVPSEYEKNKRLKKTTAEGTGEGGAASSPSLQLEVSQKGAATSDPLHMQYSIPGLKGKLPRLLEQSIADLAMQEYRHHIPEDVLQCIAPADDAIPPPPHWEENITRALKERLLKGDARCISRSHPARVSRTCHSHRFCEACNLCLRCDCCCPSNFGASAGGIYGLTCGLPVELGGRVIQHKLKKRGKKKPLLYVDGRLVTQIEPDLYHQTAKSKPLDSTSPLVSASPPPSFLRWMHSVASIKAGSVPNLCGAMAPGALVAAGVLVEELMIEMLMRRAGKPRGIVGWKGEGGEEQNNEDAMPVDESAANLQEVDGVQRPQRYSDVEEMDDGVG